LIVITAMCGSGRSNRITFSVAIASPPAGQIPRA
jgi:hypothetical protein